MAGEIVGRQVIKRHLLWGMLIIFAAYLTNTFSVLVVILLLNCQIHCTKTHDAPEGGGPQETAAQGQMRQQALLICPPQKTRIKLQRPAQNRWYAQNAQFCYTAQANA
jgi:hypothetical protein